MQRQHPNTKEALLQVLRHKRCRQQVLCQLQLIYKALHLLTLAVCSVLSAGTRLFLMAAEVSTCNGRSAPVRGSVCNPLSSCRHSFITCRRASYHICRTSSVFRKQVSSAQHAMLTDGGTESWWHNSGMLPFAGPPICIRAQPLQHVALVGKRMPIWQL